MTPPTGRSGSASARAPCRCTRLADLVNAIDRKLVAAAFGLNPEGVMIYLADYIDDGRLAPGRAPACPDPVKSSVPGVCAGAQLMLHRGRIEQSPVFSELAVPHADHVQAGDFVAPPGRRMSTAQGVAVDGEVT